MARVSDNPPQLYAQEILFNLQTYIDTTIRRQEQANPVHVRNQLKALASMLDLIDDSQYGRPKTAIS